LGFDELNQVAFVHVPKCGGTSVTDQLKGLKNWRWDQGLFDHPQLGLIALAHIPLCFLRTYYPEDFVKLVEFESFALVRDPHERFASAVFERLDWYAGVNRLRVTIEQALDEARSVMKWLEQKDTFCDAEYIHFCRQIDFVSLEGERIVKNIYRLEDMAAFARHLRETCGVQFEENRKLNRNYATPYPHVFSIAYRLRPYYRVLTTAAFRKNIVNFLTQLGRDTVPSIYRRFRSDPEISNFVKIYYAEDFVVWQAANTRTNSQVPAQILDIARPRAPNAC
jgi:Sulfotransferase family